MHSNDDKREWIDPAQGLSDSQVQERIDAGCVNTQDERITKSYEEIFRDNVLTLFNLINAILAGLIIFIGSFKNLLFLGVVISNLVIGILQEIRAKRVLDKLSLITQPYLKVLRNGKEMELHMDDIVLDDILCLSTGSQVCADAMVVEGRLEVNEYYHYSRWHSAVFKAVFSDGEHSAAGDRIYGCGIAGNDTGRPCFIDKRCTGGWLHQSGEAQNAGAGAVLH